MVAASLSEPAPTLSETDAARYTWDDLSPAERLISREKALDDYRKYGAFGHYSTWGEVYTMNPNAQIFSGKWVDKAVVREGKLIGKSRFTPRGFEEKGSFAGMYEAR